MKVSDIKCKLKHQIPTMAIFGSYVFEFSVCKHMGKKSNSDNKRNPTYILACFLTLIVKELKISVE